MYRRFIKEFRQLLLPSCVAAGAACMMLILAMVERPSEADAAQFFFGLCSCAFFGGIAIAAGTAFGAEFQQRTLGLVISQPISRSRVWYEKMLALLSAVAGIGLVFYLSQKLVTLTMIHWGTPTAGERFLLASRQKVLLGGICVLGTLCSAGFWTLFARSTLGGIVFIFAGQFFLALGAVFVLQKVYGPDLSFEDPIVTAVIVTAGVIYSALFLWLGRRKFARLELRDVPPGESAFSSGALAGAAWWSDWLRGRRRGATLNLIRKELRLQKPVFLIAAVLLLCWLVTLTLLLLIPARKEVFDAILNLLTVIYVAVLPLLAGCISLGEEKTLGLTAWHLTLPISVRRQWLLKLSVSMTVAGLLGFALPYLLAWLTAIKTNVGLFYLMHEKYSDWSLFLTLCGLAFFMSFWAITLPTNTLRAALASVTSLVALCFCVPLAVWCAWLVGPFETGLLILLTAYFQLPPEFFSQTGMETYGIILIIAIVVVTTLTRSLAQFRCAETPSKIIWKYSASLAAVVFLLVFWLADFGNSASALRLGQSLQWELSNALASLPVNNPEPASSYRTVTLRDLEQTGKLSALTKTWLKNTSIEIWPPAVNERHSPMQTFPARITFPNGRWSGINFQKPRPQEKGDGQQKDQTNQPTTGEKP